MSQLVNKPFNIIGVDWKEWVLSPTLGTIIKKSYNGSSVLSTSLDSKNFETSSMGLGGTTI